MDNNTDMKLVGQRIKARREALGMTQEELADLLGYKSRSSLNKIELGIQGLRQSKIKAVADALRTTPSYIMLWTDNPDRTPDNIVPISTVKVPLIGEIACGEPIEADEEVECYVEPGAPIHCDFALKAKGDSMEGVNLKIHDGDIVFVRKQSTVENGEIAVVIIDNDATLKRVYYYPDDKKLVLQAENSKYAPFVYVGPELETVHILGKAVAFQSYII